MERKVYTLIALFAVVLALIGVIYVVGDYNPSVSSDDSIYIDQTVYREVIKETPKTSTRTNVVTEDYVKDLDNDANVVVMTKDGSAYAVTAGTVLVEDRLVTINEEGKSVYYVDDPKKSVSSE